MRRALVLALLAGCGEDAASSCLDQAEWQVDLSHAGRTESTLALASDGVFVAIGDAGLNDIKVGSQTVHGAHLLHLGADGSIIALEPAPEGNGMTGPARVDVDDDDNVYIAWTSASRTVVASYNRDLHRRWYWEITAEQTVAFDVEAFGYSAILTKDSEGGYKTVRYMDPDGNVRWILNVDNEGATQLVMASNEDVFTWTINSTNSLRWRLDQFSGAEGSPIAYDGTASVLYDDGGFVSATASRLARVGTNGEELWSRDFQANIGQPIATADGDVLLPAATGSEEELPFVVVLIDGLQGYTKAARSRCARTILWAADESDYYGIGDGGDHPGSIARFPL